jgi:hypothetical protein
VRAGSLEPPATHTEFSDASTRDTTSITFDAIYLVWTDRAGEIPPPAVWCRSTPHGQSARAGRWSRTDLATNVERMACRNRASTSSCADELAEHVGDHVETQRLLGNRASSDEQ